MVEKIKLHSPDSRRIKTGHLITILGLDNSNIQRRIPTNNCYSAINFTYLFIKLFLLQRVQRSPGVDFRLNEFIYDNLFAYRFVLVIAFRNECHENIPLKHNEFIRQAN